MNWLNTAIVLGATYLAVFWEAAFSGVSHVLGAQIDLLPPLMVYAALCTGLTTVALLALCGGLWFDSLSANPLGVTVLPMFAIGLAIYLKRDLILRDETFARLMLGLGASAVAPVLTLLLLFTMGRTPLVRWARSGNWRCWLRAGPSQHLFALSCLGGWIACWCTAVPPKAASGPTGKSGGDGSKCSFSTSSRKMIPTCGWSR